LGYIGLPTASTFANAGLKVLGVDINNGIIDTLLSGKIHIHEPGLLESEQKAVRSGNLTVALKPEPADAFIISVPTPFYAGKKADLRAVQAATKSILPVLRKGNLVILESTSPPRTTIDIVAPILEQSGLKAGKDFFLAYSPERVLPGQILRELVENDRVIGGITPESAEAGKGLYGIFVKGQIFTTDSTTAEMVKLMENTYRDVNIAIANEFLRLADRFGCNVWEAITLANHHPRVRILNPGPGVGGHCISVDPWFFVEQAPDITKLILAARQVNDSQPEYVCQMVERKVHGLNGKAIAVLGLSYKPDVDDIRESPAIEIATLLSAAGASVVAYEPFKKGEISPHFKSSQTLAEATQGVDAILLLVGHQEFRQLTPAQILNGSLHPIVIDSTGAWSKYNWDHYGVEYFLLGNGNGLRKMETHENLD
jgi:UDP-N-acetyl-D-mannosaminuronic acid dehydrogenase